MQIFKNALLANNQYQDIFVKDGIIQEISSNINYPKTKIIDCEGRLLLTGMIDPHVHMRNPGFPHKETIESGTKAALRGGVTSIIDMPNTNPLCISEEILIEKKSIYNHTSYTNYGFHFGGDARDNSLKLAHNSQYAALKIFLNESTGHMLITDNKVLEKLFDNSHFIAVHAEGDAVDKAIFLANKYKNTLYLCHISQEGELNFIKKAKLNNPNIYAEVCPHHILFNESNITELLTMKPTLHSKKDQEALLEAMDSGLIDTWGTDHAPHLKSEKEKEITYGIPGIEFALEILLTISKEMNWNYKKVQDFYSTNAKEIFKIKNKAYIKESYDADFVLIEPNNEYIFQESDIISKCGWSPYVGYKSKSKIFSTYIGGQKVYDNKLGFSKSLFIKELHYER